jgi:hypothetical protein
VLNTINSATQYNVMPPPGATLSRHSIGCRVSVQNLIRAEDVRARFELAQNPVYKEIRCKGMIGLRLTASVS